MDLKDQIFIDYQKIKEKRDEEQKFIISMLRSAIKNAEKKVGRDLNDDEIVQLVLEKAYAAKEIHAEAVKTGKTELSSKQETEIKIMIKYLPAEMHRQFLPQSDEAMAAPEEKTKTSKKGKGDGEEEEEELIPVELNELDIQEETGVHKKPEKPEGYQEPVTNVLETPTVDDKAQQKAAVPVEASSASVLVIGKNVSVNGQVSNCEVLKINGNAEMTVDTTAKIIVEKEGRFKGDAKVKEAQIGGTFEGKLSVEETLLITSDGRVDGKVNYGSIEIRRGGIISGEVHQGEEKADERSRRIEAYRRSETSRKIETPSRKNESSDRDDSWEKPDSADKDEDPKKEEPSSSSGVAKHETNSRQSLSAVRKSVKP
ncbi:MAG: GatB/YqeY domain-containing protein [Pseudomonadota bacterium]